MSYRSALLGGAAFAALATLGGLLVSRAEPAPRTRGLVFSYAPDSTPLFGPKRFNAPSSGSTIYTERFLAVAGSAYLLKIENGAPDGTGRVSTGTIRLNSTAILSPSDFAGAPALLTRFVQLTASDTLKVELSAGSGQFVTASVLASPNARYPIHGPTLVTVPSGSQVTVNDDFSLPAGTSGPFRVHVVNGPDGSTRVSNATVTLNGTDVLTQNDINANIAAVERAVTLTSSNTVTVKVKQSSAGNRLSIRFTATDTTKPKITLTAPSQNALTGNTSITVSGSIDDKTVTAVTVNGANAPLNATGAFSVSAPLGNEGQNTLTITAIDANGNRTDSTRTVIRDTQPPNLDVYHPIPDLVTPASSEFTRGPVSDLTAVTVTANGLPQALTGDGFFEDMVPLSPGVNQITFVATDVLGHTSTVVRTVVRDNTAPSLTVTAPADNSTTTASSISVTGTANDATALGVTVNGDPVSLDEGGAFSTTIPLDEGANVITVVATDAAGNTSAVVRNVTRETEPLPPDPSAVAPPLDRTVATTMAAATEFLYTGANPIQTGVASGTIDAKRVAVLRGAVKKRDGSALSGVEIEILDHAEFGRTLSRADGAFDLAVNGGGLLTVNYKRDGFLPVQRQVNAPWQDYEIVDDVVMVPLDTAVTTIDFSTPMQVARGSVVTDADGSRQATIMFPQGTQATMVMPNGSTQPLSTIDVRATEYTIGETGPSSAPGDVPATGAATYAVNLSVDEALTAGAREILFSQPIALYVENFMGFPVGTRLPLGFYSEARAAWIPSPDGRIIKILSIAGGTAVISVDSSGATADSATLASLGVSTAELQQLASLYAAGQTLWRVVTDHFSMAGIILPCGPKTAGQDQTPKQQKPDDTTPDCRLGSVIECTTQVLGEEIEVTSAPFRLSYRSNRVRGDVDTRTIDVRLTGPMISEDLRGVVLQLRVAGRLFTQSFAPDTNLTTSFTWDGNDAYGRRVQGQVPILVRVGYKYPREYYVAPDVAAGLGLTCFGQVGSSDFQFCELPRQPGDSGTTARNEITRWNSQYLMIGTLDASALGIGGWDLDIHHFYDPSGKMLYLGDGSRRSTEAVLTEVAGTGTDGFSGDGGPANQANLHAPKGLAVAPDGSIYIADQENFRVRKVSPNGTISTVAGTGVRGNTGDGGPALQAKLGRPESLALAPDGSLYIGFRDMPIVRRVAVDGTITAIAGGDSVCNLSRTTNECGYGGPATSARLFDAYGLAVGRDGTVYIADGNHLLLRIGPDGIITRIGGDPNEDTGFCDVRGADPTCGDGGPVRQARFFTPWDLQVGPDGSLYVLEADVPRIRRVSPDGIIRTVVGGTTSGFSGDGGPATLAQAGAAGFALGSDGSLYLADWSNNRVRRVGPDGIITTIAGTGALGGNECSCGPGNPPRQVPATTPERIAVGPDGTVYFSQSRSRVRRISGFFAGFTGTAFTIASEDGAEVFEFDGSGRHLRTKDALTKRVLFAFAYDSAGRLSTVTDADGNVTRLERNASGALTAFVGPFGQRTTVTLDSLGYLATLTNPAGEVVRTEHDSLGMLARLTDAKQNPPHVFTYNARGRLSRDDDPGGGFQTLAGQATDTSFVVPITTALNRVSAYAVHFQSDSARVRLFTDPAGLVTRTEESQTATTTVVAPDSSVVTVTEKADPRFGMQAPMAGQFSVRMPSGLLLTGASVRRVTLTNPNDPLSLTTQVDSLTVNGQTFTSLFDAAARTLTATSAEGRQTVTQLDTLGRVVEERASGIAPVRYGYGPRGFLTTVTQAGRVLRYDYDSSGRVKKVTDPLGRFEQYAYDSVGRVVKQMLFNGREILYGYDANGNLTSLTPPGRPVHTFAYTAGNLDSVYSPPPAGLAVSATKYTFNLDRQLTRVLRPDSLAIDVAYDTAGRPSRLTLPNGQVQFAYSPTSGNLTRLTAPDGGSVSFAYDGSLPKTASFTGAVQGSVGFKYDSSFRVSKIAVNGADSIAFGYDQDNLLTSAGAMTLLRDSLNGRLVRTVLGSDTSTWTYDDSSGAVTHYAAKHGATTLFDVLYTRDSLDRIVGLEETIEGVTTVKGFTYDSLGRLDQVRVNGVLVSDYGYDANGNRTSLTTQSGTVSGTYDDQDRMLSYDGASYAYTANGELRMKVVGADTTWYTYDALGELLQVRLPTGDTIDYSLDANGRLLRRRTNGLSDKGFLYQGPLSPIAELDANNVVVTRFVYGTRSNVPDYMIKGDTAYRLITDQLGSVRLVINTVTGRMAQRLNYDESGRAIQNTAPGFQPFGFAGGLYDASTQLVRLGARVLGTDVGRWMTRDPLGFAGLSSNLYSYAYEDPINNVDPTGRQVIVVPRPRRVPSPFDWPVVGPTGPSSALDDFVSLARDQAAFVGQMCLMTGIAAFEQARQGFSWGGELIPTTPGKKPSQAEDKKVQEQGKKHGCMDCGTMDPGSASGRWIRNHVPPTSLRLPWEPQQLGPHCVKCSNKQGNWLKRLLEWFRNGGSGSPPEAPVVP